MICVPLHAAVQLQAHAVARYPEECCGILVGTRHRDQWHVERIVEAENIAEKDRNSHYQIDWESLFQTLRSVRDGPARIVGFYHSHPDGTARPSPRDHADAWPDHVYLIIAMRNGRVIDFTAWRKPAEDATFMPETFRIA